MAKNGEENVSLRRVTTVASGWMLDFAFLRVCRCFKEGDLEEFTKMISLYESLSRTFSHAARICPEKGQICAFLHRIMHGKDLDSDLEKDDNVMPLVSAAKIWSDLKKSVADDMFKNIEVLLLAQSVVVCLENGRRSTGFSVLKWFEDNLELPKSLGPKLKTIISQSDTYHPFLMNFSFSRLLEEVQSYVDDFLGKNPSDYLFKAATEAVQQSHSDDTVEDTAILETSGNYKKSRNQDNQENSKMKRKLLSIKITDVWKGDEKSPITSKISRREQKQKNAQPESSQWANTTQIKTRKRYQKWTPMLDKRLKDGVRHHGVGKWSRILLDFDFEGRTGTMLKDRWRVLMRPYEP